MLCYLAFVTLLCNSFANFLLLLVKRHANALCMFFKKPVKSLWYRVFMNLARFHLQLSVNNVLVWLKEAHCYHFQLIAIIFPFRVLVVFLVLGVGLFQDHSRFTSLMVQEKIFKCTFPLHLCCFQCRKDSNYHLFLLLSFSVSVTDAFCFALSVVVLEF